MITHPFNLVHGVESVFKCESRMQQVQAAVMVTATTPPGDCSSKQHFSGRAVSVQLLGQNATVLRAEYNIFEGRIQQIQGCCHGQL